ncbi:Putative amidohydrolase YtcJ [Leucoagaricus sp. SymC.cos]|nr:Putative amidohydrolase YtcJ [Leucoagaricus sp. SymC.cos]
MSPHETTTSNGEPNGSLKNGRANGSTKLNGTHTSPASGTRKTFQKKYNALFAFAFLGAVWAMFRSPSFEKATQALCTQEGGRVYTVDEHGTTTECVVFRGVHILDTGTFSEVQERWGNGLLQSVLSRISSRLSFSVQFVPHGAIIIPGVTDSHAHILEYGAGQELSLGETQNVQGMPQTIYMIEFILNNPDILNDKTKWIHYHALWVSNQAMKLSTPFPDSVEGGVIVRDGKGRPTGVFLDNARDLIKQPGLTEDDLLRRFKITVNHAHAKGLTSVHDAGLDPASLAFFKKQAEKSVLPVRNRDSFSVLDMIKFIVTQIRIYGMTHFDEHQPYWGNTTQPIIGKGDYRLTARSVKIFADGALRTGGAALYEPYHDNPETSGFLRLDPEVLFDVIPKFLADGWQVNVHAIGDRANGIVLDAFEASLKGANVTALRPRLEHAQMMTRADMKRLGELGVIASVQPTHAISDMWYAKDRLGPERVKLLYAFRSVVDSGARITLGSDFPVESMNPLSAFYAAITRVSPDGKSPHGPGGWFPEQRLSRTEALRGMTIDPAYASFMEGILGSIEVGKRADFTIFSQDIMTITADKILDTKVVATVIDGKTVFGNL